MFSQLNWIFITNKVNLRWKHYSCKIFYKIVYLGCKEVAPSSTSAVVSSNVSISELHSQINVCSMFPSSMIYEVFSPFLQQVRCATKIHPRVSKVKREYILGKLELFCPWPSASWSSCRTLAKEFHSSPSSLRMSVARLLILFKYIHSLTRPSLTTFSLYSHNLWCNSNTLFVFHKMQYTS